MAQVEVVDDLDKLFCSKTVAVCYKQASVARAAEGVARRAIVALCSRATPRCSFHLKALLTMHSARSTH